MINISHKCFSPLSLLFFISCQNNKSPNLRITEVMSNNSQTLLDQFSKPSDWIEITNLGKNDINLNQFWLSDNIKSGVRWDFPHHILPAGKSIVVFASGRNLRDMDEPLHSNFRLNKHHENIYLLFQANTLIDHIEIPNLSLDTSWGRETTNLDNLGLLTQATPKSFLNQKIFKAPRNNRIELSEIQFAHKSQLMDEYGQLNDWVEIYNPTEKTIDLSLYYLSDSSQKPQKWKFPNETIAPKEHKVFFASDQDDAQHISFQFSVQDSLILSEHHAGIIEEISLKDGFTGLLSKIDNAWYADAYPTPYQPNYRSRPKQIYISEIYPYTDAQNVEWIEIHNPTNTSISLEEYSLFIDDVIYKLPKIQIDSLGYTQITISKETEGSHIQGKLPSKGALLRLVKDFIIFDAIRYGKGSPDYSIGKMGLTRETVFFLNPSPGEKNSGPTFLKVVQAPILNKKSGFYNIPISVFLQRQETETKYHYTIDGSEPSQNSEIFKNTLEISTNTVLRIKGFHPQKIPSSIASYSFIFEEKSSLPSIHLYFTPSDFFDPTTGIHVLGPNPSPESPFLGANFWKNTKVPVYFSLWEEDGHTIFEASGRIRMFGGYSRALPLKSFQLMANKKYGPTTFDFPFFPQRPYQKFSSIVIRGSGQGQLSYYFKDILAFDLMQHLNLPALAYRSVHLYLNEKYWGIYNIREKFNEEYISHLYEIPISDIQILDIGVSEENHEWKQFINNLMIKKPTVESYAWIQEQIDMNSLIDMLLFHIYFSNIDYGNTRMWKRKDGKWTFIVYDVDFMLTSGFQIEELFLTGGFRFRSMRVLTSRLLQFPQFREAFLNRAGELHYNQLSINRFEHLLETYSQRYGKLLEDLEDQKIYRRNGKAEIDYLRMIYQRHHQNVPMLLASVLPIPTKDVLKHFEKPSQR